jgi:hypothetical protein
MPCIFEMIAKIVLKFAGVKVNIELDLQAFLNFLLSHGE